MNIFNHEDAKGLIETQLTLWPLAKKNYDALSSTKRRSVKVGDLVCGVQFNPARIVSTAANTDRKSIENRKCFLCQANRPEEQIPIAIMPGWELLVNPYPIFPVHFTIVATDHRPQEAVPADIVEAALRLPGMTVFFNGAKAGASLPDHMHMQAVLKDEIPLISLVEKIHPDNNYGLRYSPTFGLDLPFFFISGVVDPADGQRALSVAMMAGGVSPDGTFTDREKVNVFFWMSDRGVLRFISIPRKCHRPSSYFEEGERQRMVSPGCIDMGGVLILPREKDYDTLEADEIRKIYQEVAYNQNLE